MITATVWVRGPEDINWRINAVFHRDTMTEALERAVAESTWYQRQGYRVYVGPDAPEQCKDHHAMDGDS